VFTTTEAVELSGSLVVRHADGSLQPFSRDKLFISVLRAVGHRQQPLNDASALTITIIANILHSNTAAINSAAITKFALTVLQNFDKAAAVQYQAYHKG